MISGQLLSDKRVSTSVLVEMVGLMADSVRNTYKTKKVDNNGINPVYESKLFKFSKIILPELAMLRLAVIEENGRVLGQRILPVKGLRPGKNKYRISILRSRG